MSYDPNTGRDITWEQHVDARYRTEVDQWRGKCLTNAEVAERLPEEHRARFWREKLDIFFAEATS